MMLLLAILLPNIQPPLAVRHAQDGSESVGTKVGWRKPPVPRVEVYILMAWSVLTVVCDKVVCMKSKVQLLPVWASTHKLHCFGMGGNKFLSLLNQVIYYTLLKLCHCISTTSAVANPSASFITLESDPADSDFWVLEFHQQVPNCGHTIILQQLKVLKWRFRQYRDPSMLLPLSIWEALGSSGKHPNSMQI